MKIWAELPFVLSRSMRLTDRQAYRRTDISLVAKAAVYIMERGKTFRYGSWWLLQYVPASQQSAYELISDVQSQQLKFLFALVKLSINQSTNQFTSRHSTEARATVRLCRVKEKCLETDLKCVNGWSSSTVQWKRVPNFVRSMQPLLPWTQCREISLLLYSVYSPRR